MNHAGRTVRRARRATVFALLAYGMAIAGGGCGKMEDSSPRGVSPPGEGARTGSTVPGAVDGELSVPAGGGITVIVAPMAPSRISPPSVSVKSPPGRGAEVVAVKWVVNGVEQESGPHLAPSLFQRADRIHAIVKLRSNGDESLLTTPEVVAVNALPAVSEVRIDPQAITSGSTVRAIAQALDPDGDPLRLKYQWNLDNVPVPGDGDTMTLGKGKRGSWVHVLVTPSDGFADGAWKASPRYQVVNARPVVRSELPKQLTPGRKLVYRIVAEDPDGDPLTYTLTKGPQGMVLAGTTLEWQVPDEFVGKQVDAVVEISDGSGGRTIQNISMTIQPPK